MKRITPVHITKSLITKLKYEGMVAFDLAPRHPCTVDVGDNITILIQHFLNNVSILKFR